MPAGRASTRPCLSQLLQADTPHHSKYPTSTHCPAALCSRCYIDNECEKRNANAKREGQSSSNEEDIVLIKSPRKQP
eukprot:scaffold18059_cov94-Skeletonema_dohrnii-CCMP3373.AAC.2